MPDYFAVILNGLFTGIGVILANWLWTSWLEKKAKNLEQNAKKFSDTFKTINANFGLRNKGVGNNDLRNEINRKSD